MEQNHLCSISGYKWLATRKCSLRWAWRSADPAVRRNHKVTVIILVIWFALLASTRILLSFLLANVWVGSVGAMALTFLVFFTALYYSPLRKYRSVVASTLANWYKKKYVIATLVISTLIIGTIIFLADYGYSRFGDKLLVLSDVNDYDVAQKQVNGSVRSLVTQGYSLFDVLSIMVASIDRSMDGYYLKIAGFVLAENLEIGAFLLFIKKSKLFQKELHTSSKLP